MSNLIDVRTRLKYANAYFVGRAYGGPEEGGWWFDVGDFAMSLPFMACEGTIRRDAAMRGSDGKTYHVTHEDYITDEESRESARDHLRKLCDLAGMNVEDKEFIIYIEDEPGQDFPAARPRYE